MRYSVPAKKKKKKKSSDSNQDRRLAILDKKDQSLKTWLLFPGPRANQHQETAVCAYVRKRVIKLHWLSEGTVISRALVKN